MGTHWLVPHPDTAPKTIESVGVELERTAENLWLRYTIRAPLKELALPDPGKPVRADGLWQSTCLEVFVRDRPDGGYLEFNFSPSGEWAAYRFAAYRDGMEELPMASGPGIGLDASDDHLALEATVPLGAKQYSVALAAVVEELDGTKSFWSLAHPPGKADFHHPACFALTLPAPNAA